MRNAYVLAAMAAALILSGCASTPAPVYPADAMTPQQAVAQVAQWAPRTVKGTYAFEVKAVGRGDELTFVNSEADFRDPGNLALAITPQALIGLEAKFGGPLDKTAVGKRLLVRGSAQRDELRVYDDGRYQKSEFQTRIHITDASQVDIL
jgi:hypothetical protein